MGCSGGASKSADWWMIQVDAQNGKIIGKNNLTIYEGQHNFNEDIINVEKIEKPEKDFLVLQHYRKIHPTILH